MISITSMRTFPMSLLVEGMVLQRADGVRLLGPLSLSLAAGDRLGLMGESGSGKSLLVQALFRALPRGVFQTHGRLTAFGEPVAKGDLALDPTFGAKLTWVPQDPLAALNPMLTLAEHLALLPEIHRQESPKAALSRLSPLLERLRLPTGQAFLSRLPHQLSGGQRQRICLVMALSCDPDLLVLDEPTAALDPLAQRDFLDLMLELQRERGLGFLWITHERALASAACDRLLVLYGGELVEAGPTAQVLASPRHPYTARLLEAARHQPSLDPGFLPAPQERPSGCPYQRRCAFVLGSCASWGPWRGSLMDGLRCERPLEPSGRP